MKSEQVFLSVVIPAYNEEKRLPGTLQSVLEYLRKQDFTWEVVIVDDGSKDNTADLVRSQSLAEPRVRLLQYGGNRGKGYAVRYGMTHAKGMYRLFMDADNSTTLDHWDKFREHAKKFDVAIGSRDIEGADVAVHQNGIKELAGNMGNLWIQLWAVPGIKDTQAGFKVFRGDVADKVFSRLTIDRWGFDVEALAVTRLLGYTVGEFPIRWVNDADSKVSYSAYIEVLKEVVQVRLNIWRGVYTKDYGGSQN